MLKRLKNQALRLRHDTYALYLAARHPRTPWHAKVLAAGVAAYALSPIDLIPDFIPVLGYVDDLIIIPLGIGASVRLIPADVMSECRTSAAAALSGDTPTSRAAAVFIVIVWMLAAGLALCPLLVQVTGT